ncbi:hypothetical protein [Streptomyces sp. NPDC055085]
MKAYKRTEPVYVLELSALEYAALKEGCYHLYCAEKGVRSRPPHPAADLQEAARGLYNALSLEPPEADE